MLFLQQSRGLFCSLVTGTQCQLVSMTYFTKWSHLVLAIVNLYRVPLYLLHQLRAQIMTMCGAAMYHSPPGVVCKAWAWEVLAPWPLRRSPLTCSHHSSISWLTTWHRLSCPAIQMWIVCGAATLAAAFSACLGHSSGHQTLSRVTQCHGFQTVINSLSWLAVLFVDLVSFLLRPR